MSPQQGIRVNTIAPGGILTPALQDYFNRIPGGREHTESIYAMQRLGKPEEIADAGYYLLSDRTSFITRHVLELSALSPSIPIPCNSCNDRQSSD